MTSEELPWLSAAELAAAIRAKMLSPVEVTKALFDRIRKVNPKLNAFVTLHEEEALSAAGAAEQAVMRGESVGPLHGVPLHVKDNLFVAGSRTTFGSRLLADNVTSADCPAVERLRRAGMIVVGRTNTPEYGWKGVTDNPLFGITRNPWNTDKTPGGSSGGASAAVAAGMGPLGLGTDGGGSLRIPASFSGVAGFKASLGRVPNWPGNASSILRHVGVVARTIGDIALAMDQLAGPDSRDLLSLPAEAVRYATEIEKGVEGKRIAWSPDYGYAPVDPEVASLCRAAANRLAEAGAVVEEVTLDWADSYETWSVFFFGVFAAALEKQLATKGDLLDPGLRRVVEKGLTLRGVEFADAHAAQHDIWAKVRTVYEHYDLLLSPTLPVPPFNVGQDDADPRDGVTLGPLQWTRFTYLFNLTGQPAISVPAGWTASGLPVGVQIVGNRYDDLLVLQGARAWEQVQPWRDRRPPVG